MQNENVAIIFYTSMSVFMKNLILTTKKHNYWRQNMYFSLFTTNWHCLLFQDLHSACFGTVLILPSSWKRDGGKSLHSLLPMKSTMSSSPPLAMICVIRRRAVTSLLLPGAPGLLLLHVLCMEGVKLHNMCLLLIA